MDLVSRTATYSVGALFAGLVVACIVGAGEVNEEAVPAGKLTAAREQEQVGRRGPVVGEGKGGAGCSTADCHAAVKQFSQVHQPVDEDQCDLCHEPKAGATPFQAGLRHEFKRAAGNSELCYECHDRLDEETYVHKPVEQGLCILCHDPHGSERASLLVGRAFQPVIADDRALCMQCHLPGLLQGDHVHQPVAEGKCGECHEYHGGDHRRLLRGPFTAELYESFDPGHYELCYTCHEPGQVTEPTTTTLTNFRNGDKNLHYTHVNRAEKGRTCNVCHQVHASVRPHLVSETAPFGDWQLPLNFQATKTGGSCLPGCHRKREYDRVSPLRNE